MTKQVDAQLGRSTGTQQKLQDASTSSGWRPMALEYVCLEDKLNLGRPCLILSEYNGEGIHLIRRTCLELSDKEYNPGA